MEPKYPLLTLDTSTATKAFDNVKTILGQTCGVTGVLLLYVIRVALVPPEDDIDDPAFGDEDSKYISIDMEMIARAQILSLMRQILATRTPVTLRTMDHLCPPSWWIPRRFGSSSWHASASQVHGNTSRNLQTSRMDAKRGAPSTIISLGGTR